MSLFIRKIGFENFINHHEVDRGQEILPFSILPSELKAHILSYLPLNEIINFGILSRSSYELVAPYLSDSIVAEDYADEYSIDTWIEMVNRLKGSKMEKIGTLQDCKKLFLKTLLEQRSCRYCKKGTPNFKTFLKRKIVKSCRCDGYICRQPCWNAERLAHESVAKCSKCGYEYQFTFPENTGIIPKCFSQYPVSSHFVLTAVSSISCLLFVYSLVSLMGHLPTNSSSEIWIKLEDIWVFKHLPMWKYFVNGMSIVSLLSMVIIIIISLFDGTGTGISNDGSSDLVNFEALILIATILIVIATPFFLGREVKKLVLRKAIDASRIKAPQKHDLEQKQR